MWKRIAVAVAAAATTLGVAPAALADEAEIAATRPASQTIVIVTDFKQAGSGWGIGRAIRAWNAAQGVVHLTRKSTPGATVVHVHQHNSPNDGMAAWTMARTPITVIPGAVEGTWVGTYADVDVWLDSSSRPAGKHLSQEWQCQNAAVVAHELGHALGLPHLHDAPGSLMGGDEATFAREGCATPAPADVAALLAVYGA